MKKMKVISCFLAAALIAASFAGCGSSADTKVVDTSQNQEHDQKPNEGQRGVMAKVVSLEGDQITVVLADMSDGMSGAASGAVESGDQSAASSQQAPPEEGQQPGNGERPEGAPANGGPQGDGEKPQEGMQPPQASGSAVDGDSQKDGQLDQPGQGGRKLQFTGEEVTYSLSDDLKVTKGTGDGETEIDLSEIAADSIIMFTTSDEDGSEVITSIRILDKAV